jgi:hypothetical protein
MPLRIPDEQARALGLGDLIPKRKAGRPGSGKDEFGRNKLEAKFGRYLDYIKQRGDIKDYRFESVKFRLAKRTWFTPDYYAIRSDDAHLVFEVKGHWEDDARVKIKVAAEMYPHLRWAAVRWVDSGWDFEYFGNRDASRGTS